MTTPPARLARPSEPLRWELLPGAAGEQDDYRLRLVQANGAPAPRFFCSLQGRPALYLAADAVFKGPPPLDAQLDVRKEIQIPALAVESPPGRGVPAGPGAGVAAAPARTGAGWHAL